MSKPFISLVSDFIDANGKKILDQPDRFKSLFLDFSQNEYRAEAQIFSQFLASNQAKELKNSDDVDTDFLKGVAERFYQTYFFDRGKCEQAVTAYAFFLGLIDKKNFSARLNQESGDNAPKAVRVEMPRMETGDAVFQANNSSENTKKCNNCDNTIPVIFKFCPYCGSNEFDVQKKLLKKKVVDTILRDKDIWICGKCKTQNGFILNFCKNCGKEFWP